MPMATQQATPATDSSMNRARGDMPSGRSLAGALPATGGATSSSGGRRASISDKGSISTKQVMPTPI